MAKGSLTSAQLKSALARLPGWSLKRGKLRRQFVFPNFIEAFAFMTKVAMISESQNHHPDWSNVYNKVTVQLWSHDVGGISDRDIRWAKSVNSLFS